VRHPPRRRSSDTYAIHIIPLLIAEIRTGRLKDSHRRLERLNALVAEGVGGPVPFVRDVLAFHLALEEGDREGASLLAEQHAESGDYGVSAYMLLTLHDDRAAEHFERLIPLTERGFLGLGEMTLPQGLREAPAYRHYLDEIGHTRDWRLELCRRAADLSSIGITCDPSKYALADDS